MTARAASRWLGVVLAAVALLAAAPGLGNGFVYDDLPIILDNPLVHRLSAAPEIWTSGYWPAGLLYRPVAVQLFALEWAAGGGSPVVFHAVSVVLAVVTPLAFWLLARRLLPPFPAWMAALLFAVHPVHVEVVANAVGQTELLASLFALVALERFLAWRLDDALPARRRGVLALLTLLAILSKETGYVIPLLIAAAELLVVRTVFGTAWRLRAAIPTIGMQMSVALMAVLLRVGILGPTTAAGPAVALRDLPATDRIVGMLAVVPEWVRLLLWPARLQAEYGPPALEVTRVLSPAHFLGLAIVLASLAAIAAASRRSPVIALGIAWVVLALLPVSNLLTPTGVILAERTLFLPSAGAMLAIGGVLAGLFATMGPGQLVARAAVGACALLAAAGAARSMERQLVWRSSDEFFDRLLQDAPDTYRAHLVASIHYARTGRDEDAERAAQRGLELYGGDPQLYEHLGQLMRREGRCAEALPILGDAVRRFPDRSIARSRLIECSLAVGDSAAALRLAEDAVRQGYREFEQTLRRLSPAPGR